MAVGLTLTKAREFTSLKSDEAPVKFIARKLQKMFAFFCTDKKKFLM